ncbi:unnamed protein product [Calypogeia fissa]
MAAAVPIVRAMEAALVLSSCSDGAAAAIATTTISTRNRVLSTNRVSSSSNRACSSSIIRANPPCKIIPGLHSRSSFTSSSSYSSSSSGCCSSSSFYSSSSCISKQTNNGHSSGHLQVSNATKMGVSSVIKARKRNGRFASRRVSDTGSRKGGKGEENSGGSVALRDPESAPVAVPAASSSVKRNINGTLVSLREIATATVPVSPSSVNSDLIGGLIALRAPEITTLPSVSSSPDLNPVDFDGAAGDVRSTPAEVAENGIESIFTSGTLSATLASLIRVQEAKLFGPGIFKASKLRVLLLGKQDDERPLQHPRIYTLTHSDLTAMITLAVAREINKAQVTGWYSKLQRDEVVAEWRRTQGEMSLHVHCHISGTNFLHRLIAKLRFYIFQKELPLVLEAFMQGDRDLFKKHPELLTAPVWVYFHSNVEDYNRVECWGSLVNAIKNGVQIQQWAPTENGSMVVGETEQQFPGVVVCLIPCECCSRHDTVIPIPESLNQHLKQSQLRRQSNRKCSSQSSSFTYLSGPT